MADAAAKEPSMEEILASIRRIISEDGEPVGEASGGETAAVAENAAETALEAGFGAPETDTKPDEDGHLLSVEDLLSDDLEFDDVDAFDDVTGQASEIAAPAVAEPVVEETFETSGAVDDVFEDTSVFEETEVFETEVSEPEPVVAFQPEPEAPVMAASPSPTRAPGSALTDDITAASAAGSLGKLISNLDLGSENTIEGLVRELLKPMIKEWLDANLPQIVERKVEAEVERIARMVR